MTLATALPLADTWGMHGDVGAGWWVVMVAGMVVFWGVVILIGARLLRDGFGRHPSTPPAETPTAVLERRLAEGAITVEEYQQRRSALAESAPADTPGTGRPLAGAAASAGGGPTTARGGDGGG
jgi:putative membrane protein